jgi:hypothetical protein
MGFIGEYHDYTTIELLLYLLADGKVGGLIDVYVRMEI